MRPARGPDAPRPRQHRSGGGRARSTASSPASRRCSSSRRSRAGRSRSRPSSTTTGSRRSTAVGGDVAAAGARFVAITDPVDHASASSPRRSTTARASSTRPTSAGATRRSPTSAWSRRRCSAPPSTRWSTPASRSRRRRATAVPAEDSAGLWLGAALGAAAKAGRDKLTLVISPAFASLGSWIEQLVAESTGKEGKGIVPVDMEPLGPPVGLCRRSAVRPHPRRRGRRAGWRP